MSKFNSATTLVNLEKLEIADLLWNRETRDFDDVFVSPTTFKNDDGFILVSAEDGKGLADYYGEFRGGYPWIHPALESWADALGLRWEWENPGSIMLID